MWMMKDGRRKVAFLIEGTLTLALCYDSRWTARIGYRIRDVFLVPGLNCMDRRIEGKDGKEG